MILWPEWTQQDRKMRISDYSKDIQVELKTAFETFTFFHGDNDKTRRVLKTFRDKEFGGLVCQGKLVNLPAKQILRVLELMLEVM